MRNTRRHAPADGHGRGYDCGVDARVLLDCRPVSSRIDGLARYTMGLALALLSRPAELALTLLLPSRMPADHVLRRAAGARFAEGPDEFMGPASHLARPLLHLPEVLYHYPHFDLPVAAPRRSVITIHDLVPILFPHYFRSWAPLKRAYFRVATSFAVRRASAVIVPSCATRDHLARLFPSSSGKTRVIYEGVAQELQGYADSADVERCRERYAVQRPFVLHVGVSRPHKNLAGVIRGLAGVRDEIPHELLVVGQPIGPVEPLKGLAREVGLEGRVRWLGYVSQADLGCLYALADAFVACSFYEGFGLGVIEAMSNGVPVVASNTSAIAEVAGDAAMLVDPRSPPSIGRALATICTDDARRGELRLLGRVRAQMFTWERTADATLDLYREALRAS